MTEQRRRQLEELLDADAAADAGASRMSLICERCVSELSVSGAGATVLSNVGDGDGRVHGDGDGRAHGDGDGRAHGDGQAPRRGLVHSTNTVSAGLEDLQLTVGEGPCLDTFSTGGPVLIANLADEAARWPGFTPAALELGAASVYSFPLRIGVISLGSLDLYNDTARPLSSVQITDALVLADLATQAVMQELDGHSADDMGWLADPHAEVHQASGMLQVQLDTTTEAALMRLRAHAYTHELRLAEVARLVVRRELRFAPEQLPEQ